MSDYEKNQPSERATAVNRMNTSRLTPQQVDAEAAPDARASGEAVVPPYVRFTLVESKAKFTLATQNEIVLGRRSSPNDPEVSIDTQPYNGHLMGVSRYHALITVSGGRLTLRDLRSVNGTRLNGQIASPLQRYVLKHGDAIALGNLSMLIEFLDKK